MARLVGLSLIIFVLILAFILPPSLYRLADPFNGPMKAVARPPPVVGFSNYVLEIEANDLREAFYKLGYAHAYYRFFQMDVLRRVASGRLSELLGEDAYRTDVYFRTRGLYIAAEKTWQYIQDNYPDFATLLEEYASGVNDYLSKKPPIFEYLVLGKEPELWRPVDSIAIGKLMAWSLSGGEDDLLLKDLVEAKGRQILDFILPREANLPIVPHKVSFSPHTTLGSNNWVLSPHITATGLPILANDPHLPLTAPPIWILQKVKAPGYQVVGVAFPGSPVVVIGTNGYVAWGFTNTGVDVVDYYYYVWDGDRYFYNDTWLSVTKRVEDFKICDTEGRCRVEKIEVWETIHGPVIEHRGVKYAMRWLGNGVTLEAMALFKMGTAKNITEFLEGLRYFVVPSQNVVYADVHGVVGYFASGYFPIRDGGYLPFNGSRGEGEWRRLVWLPSVVYLIDPPFVATANNKVAESDVYLQWRWADRYRFQRIEELIKYHMAKGRVSTADVMNIQLDVVDISCRDVFDILKELGGEKSSRLLRELSNWDCTMGKDSIYAAKYAIFIYNLQKSVWGNASEFIPFEITLKVLRSGFVDKDVLETAAEKALGTNVKWGTIHKYDIRHVLGRVFPRLNYPQKEASGSWFTINIAPGFEVSQGPSVRWIVAFGDGVYMSMPGGPDGDPLSSHYYSLYGLWLDGKYVKVD
ncbi:MAG: penicillin acylase family protein [Pyrobaculum sp.]